MFLLGIQNGKYPEDLDSRQKIAGMTVAPEALNLIKIVNIGGTDMASTATASKTKASSKRSAKTIIPAAKPTRKASAKTAVKATAKKASKKVTTKTLKGEDLQTRTAQKAYEIFVKRGYSHGNDYEDWIEAEKLVRAEL